MPFKDFKNLFWGVGLIITLSLSGCLPVKDAVSGPQVRVHEIELMRNGGRLYPLSSGKPSKNASYYFRSQKDSTIQLWLWESKKKEWKPGKKITSFATPSKDYFIGRYPRGDHYVFFAYRFLDNNHVQMTRSWDEGLLKPLEGIKYQDLVNLFDDLTQRRPHVLHGVTFEPLQSTYQIKFEQPNSDQSQNGKSHSSNDRGSFDESRLRVGDRRYLAGALEDVMVQVLEVSPDGTRARVLRSDDGSTEWVDANRLISRSESATRDMGRIGVGVGIFVCLLNPEACSDR